MKAAIYLRVSTNEQSTDNQLPQLEDYARIKGWELTSVYSEQASAWRDGHQVELKRLKEDASRRRFDIVLVWALDRLSREGATAVLNLISNLKVFGVKVISYQEPWTEALGEIGEILYAIAGWVAKMESQRRSERTKAGLARLKAQGKKLGRPRGLKDKKRRRLRRLKL